MEPIRATLIHSNQTRLTLFAYESQHVPDFRRKRLYHQTPNWVKDGSTFFITVNCANRGTNQLCAKTNPDRIAESVAFRHASNVWQVTLLVLMPDHLHTLMSFPTHLKPMSAPMKAWKRYLARETGIEWQDGFFDHRIRNEDELREKAAYIRLNPVRAGLCTEPEDWPYVWNTEQLEKYISG